MLYENSLVSHLVIQYVMTFATIQNRVHPGRKGIHLGSEIYTYCIVQMTAAVLE